MAPTIAQDGSIPKTIFLNTCTLESVVTDLVHTVLPAYLVGNVRIYIAFSI